MSFYWIESTLVQFSLQRSQNGNDLTVCNVCNRKYCLEIKLNIQNVKWNAYNEFPSSLLSGIGIHLSYYFEVVQVVGTSLTWKHKNNHFQSRFLSSLSIKTIPFYINAALLSLPNIHHLKDSVTTDNCDSCQKREDTAAMMEVMNCDKRKGWRPFSSCRQSEKQLSLSWKWAIFMAEKKASCTTIILTIDSTNHIWVRPVDLRY